MTRKKVSSSNIASIGYEITSMILEVEFNNNTIYEYYEVPFSVYNALMNAKYHGTYLNEKIKGYYKYKQTK